MSEFTQAAKAEVKARWPTPERASHSTAERFAMLSFEHGAEWAAGREPSWAEVEAAAAALVFADTGEPWQPEHMPARVQRRWRAHARAALIAARDARTR